MKLKLPKNWSGITLGQFIQILDLPETDSKLNDFVSKLGVLSGEDSELIKSRLKTKDLVKYSKQLAFMSKMPKVRKLDWFFWKFRFYKRNSLDKTETIQVADIMHKTSNESNEGAKILECLSVIYYAGKDVEYNADRYDKMKKCFEDLPFDIAYRSSVFFLNGLTNYLPNVFKVFSKRMGTMTIKEWERLQEKMQKMKDIKGLEKYINGMTL